MNFAIRPIKMKARFPSMSFSAESRRLPETHGLNVMKKALKALGSRAVDKRTRTGKALAAWRLQLLSDLGGLESVSTAKLALVEEALITKFVLSSINAWMLAQPSLVSGRNRGVLPVVLHRNQLVMTLKGLLESARLGATGEAATVARGVPPRRRERWKRCGSGSQRGRQRFEEGSRSADGKRLHAVDSRNAWRS
jgi:hypothetical protein